MVAAPLLLEEDMGKAQAKQKIPSSGKARKMQVPDLRDSIPALPWVDQGSTQAESRALRRQIDKVVDSIARTGDPPQGIRQGGLPGRPGVYGNRSGKLPDKPEGYYTESDVWAGPGERGTERVVVGGRGEAYYSNDHYETFRKLPR